MRHGRSDRLGCERERDQGGGFQAVLAVHHAEQPVRVSPCLSRISKIPLMSTLPFSLSLDKADHIGDPAGKEGGGASRTALARASRASLTFFGNSSDRSASRAGARPSSAL